jgi:hypothetical protein
MSTHESLEAPETAATRKAELLNEMVQARDAAYRMARYWEGTINACFWVSTLCGLASSIAGVLFHLPEIAGGLAFIATAALTVPRLNNLREKANAKYAERDMTEATRIELKFQQPLEPTVDQISAAAERWKNARLLIGQRLAQITAKDKLAPHE